VALLSSSVIAGVILLLKNQMADVLFGDVGMASIIVIMAGTLMFRTLASVATNYFRAFRQTRTYAILSVALELGEIGLASYLVLAGYGIQGAVYALLVTRAIIFLVAISLVIRQIGIRIPHFTNIRLYLGFSLPLMTLPLIWWVLSWSDRYLIAVFLDTAQVGIYCTVDRLTPISLARSSWDNFMVFRKALIFTPKWSMPSPRFENCAVDIWHTSIYYCYLLVNSTMLHYLV
jgi:O-antigen/teichoic acid export membrane protein